MDPMMQQMLLMMMLQQQAQGGQGVQWPDSLGMSGGAVPGQGGQDNAATMQMLQAMLGEQQNPLSALLTLGNLPFAMNAIKTPYQLQLKAAQTAMDPSAMMARYGQFYRPLSKQLINEVTEAAGPSIAARGMGTSPGQVSRMLGEALAPYEMQQQQQAMNAAMNTLSAPNNIGTNAGGDYLPTMFNMGQTMGAPMNELLNYIQNQQKPYGATPDYGFSSGEQGSQNQGTTFMPGQF